MPATVGTPRTVLAFAGAPIAAEMPVTIWIAKVFVEICEEVAIKAKNT
jgi:hypothetical protein